jgi:hypothetical protein
MLHIDLALEPHVGTPIVNRAEAEGARRYRAAKQEDRLEPFQRFLADAYAAMLSGAPTKRARRPELVVLVSHEVAKRGWKDVRPGEHCEVPGVGPVGPRGRQRRRPGFTGVFYDGKDLRHMRRWTRNVPVEVFMALELGQPPEFDGVRCIDCGKRFRPERTTSSLIVRSARLQPTISSGVVTRATQQDRMRSQGRKTPASKVGGKTRGSETEGHAHGAEIEGRPRALTEGRARPAGTNDPGHLLQGRLRPGHRRLRRGIGCLV